MAAVVERAEKQIILARHSRRLLHLIDESPLVPGDARKPYEYVDVARDILTDAENDLRGWKPVEEPIFTTSSELGPNLMPKGEPATADAQASNFQTSSETETHPSGQIADPAQAEARVQAVDGSSRTEREKDATVGAS